MCPGEGVPAHIRRVDAASMTKEKWLGEFYQYGRPVIITNATKQWKLWELVARGELDALLYKLWGPDSLQSSSILERQGEQVEIEQADEQADQSAETSGGELEDICDGCSGSSISTSDGMREEVASMLLNARRQAAAAASSKLPVNSSTISLDFTGFYLMFPDLFPLKPFKGLLSPIPSFIPIPSAWGGKVDFPSFYIGGKGRGVSRHQDFSSCMVGWQVQITGIKRWRIQMPLNSIMMEAWPKKSFAEDLPAQSPWPSTMIYNFNVHPGEILVWHPQWFHNTTVVSPDNATSIAMVSHVPTINLTKRSMFHRSFWAATRCNPLLAPVYEQCWSDWFSKEE